MSPAPRPPACRRSTSPAGTGCLPRRSCPRHPRPDLRRHRRRPGDAGGARPLRPGRAAGHRQPRPRPLRRLRRPGDPLLGQGRAGRRSHGGMSTHLHTWPAQQRVRHGLPVDQALPPELADCRRVVLVTTRSLAQSRIAAAARAAIGPKLAGETSAMRAHSPVEDVLALAALLRETEADRVVALGGGSVIDGAKVACAAVWQGVTDAAGLTGLAVSRGAQPLGWDAASPARASPPSRPRSRPPNSPRMPATPTSPRAGSTAPCTRCRSRSRWCSTRRRRSRRRPSCCSPPASARRTTRRNAFARSSARPFRMPSPARRWRC
ncbi:iron-containing alcohol dehydrogenase [Paeniroseomonas aquatica]